MNEGRRTPTGRRGEVVVDGEASSGSGRSVRARWERESGEGVCAGGVWREVGLDSDAEEKEVERAGGRRAGRRNAQRTTRVAAQRGGAARRPQSRTWWALTAAQRVRAVCEASAEGGVGYALVLQETKKSVGVGCALQGAPCWPFGRRAASVCQAIGGWLSLSESSGPALVRLCASDETTRARVSVQE